jgi:hypothetical protein
VNVDRAKLDVHAAKQRHTYGIQLCENLSPWALRPWSATMTHGTGLFSELVFYARTRERLVAKCERFARRNARSCGIRGELTITIREAEG